MKGIHTPNEFQAEPKTSMKVGCWKVSEQQVAGEATVVNLSMTGDESDSGESFVSFCELNNFAVLSTVFTHIRSS